MSLLLKHKSESVLLCILRSLDHTNNRSLI